MSQTGLLIVHTGHGKGKTTAALGCMLRALGHGMRVCLIQFIKGSWPSGEIEALRKFGDMADIHVMGLGFTWTSQCVEKDIHAAREAWLLAKTVLREGRHELVVLDEITYLPKFNIISEPELLAGLRERAPGVHVIATGRDAGPGLIAAADTATEMRSIRHAFDSDAPARKGIEF